MLIAQLEPFNDANWEFKLFLEQMGILDPHKTREEEFKKQEHKSLQFNNSNVAADNMLEIIKNKKITKEMFVFIGSFALYI